jgi:hypothetical protein
MRAPSIVFPTHAVTSPQFEYRNASQTDVTITWRKFGWTPIHEVKS